MSANDKVNSGGGISSKEMSSSSNKTSSKSSSKSGTSSTKSSSKEQREPKHSKVRNHSKDSASSNEYDSSGVSTSKGKKYLFTKFLEKIFQVFLIFLDSNSAPASSNASNKDNFGKKFTTSNFTESTVVPSEPVFSNKSGTTLPVVKKRKLDKMDSSKSSNDDVNR